MLAALYLLLASICAKLVKDGAPGWLNLLLPRFLWNAINFIVIAPVGSAARLGDRYAKCTKQVTNNLQHLQNVTRRVSS